MMKVKIRWQSVFFLATVIIAAVVIFNMNKVTAAKPPQVFSEKSGAANTLRTKQFGVFYQTANEILDQRMIQLSDSKAQVVTWKELAADGAESEHYAISLDGLGFSKVQQALYDVNLRFATFDPARRQPEIPQLLRSREQAGTERGAYIVQFVTQPLEEYRSELRKLGAKDFIYLPNYSHLVMMDAETVAKVRTLPFVRWVGVYEPAYKLEEVLLNDLQNHFTQMRDARYNIMVLERGAAMQGKIAARVRELGGKVENTIAEGFRLEATLSAEQLLAISNESEVLFIDRWSAPESDMDIVRSVGGANFIRDTLGFRGEGVRAEVLDAGILLTHTDFNSGLAPIQHGSNNVDSHGTATYGINFGRGTTNAAGLGMLPEAQGIFADYDFLSNRYTHTAQLKQSPYFAVYQSNSWGSSLTTAYNTVSAEMDDILFINDIALLNSQSNAGTQQSRPQAWAKNVVSIGGVRHYNTASFSDDRWANGASTGPAADGRVKPDLAYFYDSIFTTTSSSNTAYTSTFGGTSAATPMTAGHFGVFFQMWHNGLFGNPTGATVFDSAPHMSTTKAIMVNTAVQWSMVSPSDLTRFRQGWGRADLTNLYNLRNKMFIVDETDAITNLQTKSYTVSPIGGEPLKVTMVYTDPMGNTASSVARINDLTLRVTSPSGTVYYGNNGLTAGPWSTSGGSPNTIDTVENVYIETPEAGNWTIEVIASEINQDARSETPAVDADFALVASGVNVGPPVPPTMTVSPTSFSFSATAGGANPAAQTLNISNTGGGSLNWSVTSDSAWLTATPTSGSGNGLTTVSVNITGLSAGTYNGALTVADPAATNNPVTVPVTLTLNTPPPCPSGNYLLNPGFESNSTWVFNGATRTTSFPRTGSRTSRYLNNANNATHTAYQVISIPSGCAPNLTFWLSVVSNETTTIAQNDLIFAEVRSTSGTLLGTLASFSNLQETPSAATYVQRGPYNLGAYAGQTIRLQLRATSNSSLTTAFRIDDVSIQ